MDLSEEEIIRIYGKRWDIEVLFKTCNDKKIGYAVDNRTGKKVPATGFKIHYAAAGTHIVPMDENQKEYWIRRRKEDGNDWLLRQKG